MSATGGVPAGALSDLRDAIAANAAAGRRSLARGGGTKDALSSAAGDVSTLELEALRGIVEYTPSEFTVTALAGTPIAQLATTLGERGQYLPFDPILIDAGATLGGTIAAGVSGSGRVRYGGIRDFMLGVRFLDGGGTLVRGGGKVVKNAAGFDLPKLMVGSLGSLGVVVEATLKVFPCAEASATGTVELASLDSAVAALRRLLRGPSEVEALDLEPLGRGFAGTTRDPPASASPARLWIRVAGRERAVEARLERALALAAEAGRSANNVEPGRRGLAADEAETHWRVMRELAWVPRDCSLVKVPMQPGGIAELEATLVRLGAGAIRAVYTAGGQQALVAWPDHLAIAELDRALQALGRSGLVVRGRAGARRLGRRPAEAAIERARLALDPDRRFPDP